jgi:hypothetical protein
LPDLVWVSACWRDDADADDWYTDPRGVPCPLDRWVVDVVH